MMQANELSEAAGYVDSGTLPAFLPDVPEIRRQDLLNSTLLGQLSADRLFSRKTQPQEWYKKYFDTLATVGWQLDTFNFKSLRPQSATFSIEQIGLGLLAPKLSAAELALARETMQSLRDLPDLDPRVILFNESTHSTYSVNAQFSVRTSAAMVNAGLVFTTGQKVKRLLHQEFLTLRLEQDIGSIVQLATLNEAVYSQVRESVIEKLGPRREELILKLDISMDGPGRNAKDPRR